MKKAIKVYGPIALVCVIVVAVIFRFGKARTLVTGQQ